MQTVFSLGRQDGTAAEVHISSFLEVFTNFSKTGEKMFSLLWDDADQYLGFVGVPKPPVRKHFCS